MGLEDDLEFVNFPNDDGRDFGAHKVIQLYIGRKPVMLFGDLSVQHFEILKSFLLERGIRFETLRSPPGGIPAMGGENQPYRVAGAGNNYIYTQSKLFTLPEGSSTFHSSANPEHSAIFERRMIRDGWTRMM